MVVAILNDDRADREEEIREAEKSLGHEAHAPTHVIDVSLRKDPLPHGTGFMIEGGNVVTAAHVVLRPDRLKVTNWWLEQIGRRRLRAYRRSARHQRSSVRESRSPAWSPSPSRRATSASAIALGRSDTGAATGAVVGHEPGIASGEMESLRREAVALRRQDFTRSLAALSSTSTMVGKARVVYEPRHLLRGGDDRHSDVERRPLSGAMRSSRVTRRPWRRSRRERRSARLLPAADLHHEHLDVSARRERAAGRRDQETPCAHGGRRTSVPAVGDDLFGMGDVAARSSTSRRRTRRGPLPTGRRR